MSLRNRFCLWYVVQVNSIDWIESQTAIGVASMLSRSRYQYTERSPMLSCMHLRMSVGEISSAQRYIGHSTAPDTAARINLKSTCTMVLSNLSMGPYTGCRSTSTGEQRGSRSRCDHTEEEQEQDQELQQAPQLSSADAHSKPPSAHSVPGTPGVLSCTSYRIDHQNGATFKC